MATVTTLFADQKGPLWCATITSILVINKDHCHSVVHGHTQVGKNPCTYMCIVPLRLSLACEGRHGWMRSLLKKWNEFSYLLSRVGSGHVGIWLPACLTQFWFWEEDLDGDRSHTYCIISAGKRTMHACCIICVCQVCSLALPDNYYCWLVKETKSPCLKNFFLKQKRLLLNTTSTRSWVHWFLF